MPAYNEEHYIAEMITQVKQYADEVIVVNDGSTDNTTQIATDIGAMVISHRKNLGHGAAIISILSEAKKRTFDVLVTIDADTQHSPNDIPNLIKPILEGYDLVIGSRRREDVPKYRYLGGRVLSFLTQILSGEKVSDSQSGFRAYSPKAVAELWLKETGTAWCSEMISEATKKNLRIVEVPISIKYTKDGATLNPVVQGFYTLFRITVMIIRQRALK